MKKLLTLTLIITCVLSLTACNKSSVANIGIKEKDTDVEVNWNDDFVFVDIDSLSQNGGVNFSTGNGTSISVNGNVDYSKPGTYPATISYTNSTGNVVEKETYIVVDTSSNKDARAEEVKENIAQAEEKAKEENFTSEVNDKTLNMWNDSIFSASLSEAEEYAKATWGEGSYTIQQSPKGQIVFITYTNLNCDEAIRLTAIYQNGGKLSVGSGGNTDGKLAFNQGCGIQ